MTPASVSRLPRVVIAGRPNVGKSTLFNRLTGRRQAIVHPQPGVTRDYLVGRAEYEGLEFELADTGGLAEPLPGDPFLEKVWAATEALLHSADLILFLVSARDGRTAADEILADKLRRLDRRVMLVINKAEAGADEARMAEFHRLGFKEMFSISAEHALRLVPLLDTLKSALTEGKEGGTEAGAGEAAISVAILGRPNVGKSSLLNGMLGQERSIVSDIPGTTRDAVDTEIVHEGRLYRFVDTAGMRRRAKTTEHLDKLSFLRARDALERAEVAVLVLDPSRELAHQDQAIARLVKDAGTACVIAVNKWDLVTLAKDEQAEMMEFMHRKMSFMDYAPVLRVSALEGSGLKELWRAIPRAAAARRLRIPTAKLNRDIREIIQQNPPPSRGKHAFKVLYVTQAETVPPAFVIFANKAQMLPPSYRRYLEHELRKRHPLEGTPIKLMLRSKQRGERG